jgi:uncharacterized membrane protein
METIKGWIQKIYEDNGLWSTVAVVVLIVVLVVAGNYLDVSLLEWFK